jgi:RecA-family ATPase
LRDQIHPRGLIALELASWGLRIHPLHENSKAPVLPEWQNKATTNPVVIKIWWRQANYNIGIATGRADGDLVGRELVGLDFDCKNGKPGLETFKQHALLGLVDTLLVRTGTGGIHALYWRRPGSGNGQIENSVEEIAPGVDVRGWHGYLVGPGSVVDGKVYAIMRQVDIGELPGALEEKALRGKGSSRKTNGNGAHAAGGGSGEPIGELDRAEAIARVRRYLLEEAPIAIQGAGGDNTTLQVAYWCKDLGVSEGVCLELMLEHWNPRCAPPWDADELGIKVRNAYRYGKRPPGSSSAFEEFEADPDWKYESWKDWKARQPKYSFPFINMENWDNEPVPVQEWDVPGRIPRRQSVIFSGEGGAGKSLLQLQLSVATVLGTDWLGATPRQGPAIFVDCEDDQHVLHYRLAAVARHYDVRFDALVRKGLHLSSLVGHDTVLATAERSGLIKETKLYERLLEAARDIKPVILGIAASANVFAGEENNRSQVQQFVNLLTRLAMAAGGSVVLISHPSLAGISSGTGLSGSTQWHNAVRGRMVLKQGDEKDTRVLEFQKNQYGARDETIGLRWQGGLFLPIVPLSDEEELGREETAEEVFMALLERFVSQGRRVADNLRSPQAAAKQFVLEAEAERYALTVEMLDAARRRLFDKGRIRVEKIGKGRHALEWLLPVKK